jgi:hypothetical protein
LGIGRLISRHEIPGDCKKNGTFAAVTLLM